MRFAIVATCALVVVVVAVGVARAEADGCDALARAASEEIARLRMEKAEGERAMETLREQGEAIRRGYNEAAEKLKKINHEGVQTREANAKKVRELERAESEARGEAKRNADALRALEMTIESMKEELEKATMGDSTRLSMCEARLKAAEEAWVPKWVQRRAEPVTASATQALEFGKAKGAQAVDFGKKNTVRVVKAGSAVSTKVVNAGKTHAASVVKAGKTHAASVVKAGKKHAASVVNVGKTHTAKVMNAGKAQTAKVVDVGKAQTAKAFNVGKSAVDVAVKKVSKLKELKDDVKQARLLYDQRSGSKTTTKLPEKFTTRQFVRVLALGDEFGALMKTIASKLSLVPIKNAIIVKFEGMYTALQNLHRERFVPFSSSVRALTTKHVGVLVAGCIIDALSRIPEDTLARLPFKFPKFTVDALAPRVADGIWTIFFAYVAYKVIKDIFFSPPNEFSASYTIMKVPDQEGFDVVVHLPKVRSLNEVQLEFDATWNQLKIECKEAGHSEFIFVPKCRTGIKRWAQPEPKFLDGEEILLVELRPLNLSRSASRKEGAEQMQPAPRNDAPFVPFAAVPRRSSLEPTTVEPVKKAPARKASREKPTVAAPTARASKTASKKSSRN